METILYFISILLTCAITGWLAFTELLSMFSPGLAQVLFWFNIRFIFTAAILVLFLVFALHYQGHMEWLSRRLVAVAFIIPVITQVMLWSNNLHGLWVKQEVGFHQRGLFWLSETSARIPGLWFIVHSLYSLLLLLAGIAVILVTAWGKPSSNVLKNAWHNFSPKIFRTVFLFNWDVENVSEYSVLRN